MTCQYIPGKGVLVTFTGPSGGRTVLLPDDLTLVALEEHVRQLTELAGEGVVPHA